MKEINYFTKYKDQIVVMVADMEYIKKANKLSRSLNFNKNLSDRQIASLDASATSCWIIHSKKTVNKVNYKGQTWSVYVCVVSFLSKDKTTFSEEIELPSFVLKDFGICDKNHGKQIGTVKSIFY